VANNCSVKIRCKLLVLFTRTKLQLVLKLLTLNVIMAIILHYFTKFGSFGGQLHHSR